MARENTYSRIIQTGLLTGVLFLLVPSLRAENQLSFVVRSAEMVDVHLANSDEVAAMQLFIRLDGPGTITGASLIDRTNGSGWQIPFNILDSRNIRILLISKSSDGLPSGSGLVVRIHIGKNDIPSLDSTTLSFQTAILASRDARALDVKVESITFNAKTPDSQNFVNLNNYPNPFNPSTRISFELNRPANVDLTIYDIRGRRIVVLIDEKMNAGRYTREWHGTDENGVLLPSGLYVCRLLVDGVSAARKMVLAK